MGGDDGGGGTDSLDGVPLFSFPAPQNPEDGEQYWRKLI